MNQPTFKLFNDGGRPSPLAVIAPALADLLHAVAGLLRGETVSVAPSPGATETPAHDAQPVRLPLRLHRELLGKATDTDKTARQLIREAGYKYNSTSRSGVSWLVHNGFLLMAGNGRYRLTEERGTP